MNTPNVYSGRLSVSLKWLVRLVLLNHHSSRVDGSPIAETISDLILVAAPLWILRGVRVSSGLRIRLIAVFSCSMMTTMAGVVHAVLVLKMPGAWEAIMGEQTPPVWRAYTTACQQILLVRLLGSSWKYELPLSLTPRVLVTLFRSLFRQILTSIPPPTPFWPFFRCR